MDKVIINEMKLLENENRLNQRKITDINTEELDSEELTNEVSKLYAEESSDCSPGKLSRGVALLFAVVVVSAFFTAMMFTLRQII